RETELEEQILEGGLLGLYSHTGGGSWVSAENYLSWQADQLGSSSEGAGEAVEPPALDASVLEPVLDPAFEPALEDAQAALCPTCQSYLSRSRIGFGQSFFLERCRSCGGFWFDRGEWELLSKLGLNANLDYLFTPEWQDAVRRREQFLTERRVLVEKVGEELAEEVFALAEKLEGNPNGDFAVAYFMRRFDGGDR
ncbi:MAG: zf-TFIIB domain-containing protein, partial [Cyanobacteria bacterium P01_H01_bin.130]